MTTPPSENCRNLFVYSPRRARLAPMIKTMTMSWVCVGIAGILLGVAVLGEMERPDKTGEPGVVVIPRDGLKPPEVVRPAARPDGRTHVSAEPFSNEDQAKASLRSKLPSRR